MKNYKKNKKRNIIIVLSAIAVALIAVGTVVFFMSNKNSGVLNEEGKTSLHEVTTKENTTAETTETETITKNTVSSTLSDIFDETDDLVTAKDQTNLHVSATNSSEIVVQIEYGTYLTRTGISSDGWSRLIYNGETLYARTQLLLEQGESRATLTPWTDEYNMTYQDVEERVTAKEEVNLRSVPSSKDDATIVIKISAGEYVTRIGIGDKGWSKLIYNDQIVYAITSYLTN